MSSIQPVQLFPTQILLLARDDDATPERIVSAWKMLSKKLTWFPGWFKSENLQDCMEFLLARLTADQIASVFAIRSGIAEVQQPVHIEFIESTAQARRVDLMVVAESSLLSALRTGSDRIGQPMVAVTTDPAFRRVDRMVVAESFFLSALRALINKVCHVSLAFMNEGEALPGWNSPIAPPLRGSAVAEPQRSK